MYEITHSISKYKPAYRKQEISIAMDTTKSIVNPRKGSNRLTLETSHRTQYPRHILSLGPGTIPLGRNDDTFGNSLDTCS